MKLELSVIFPVHNEELIIKKVIKATRSTLATLHIPFEIICVENGSTDNSFRILKSLSSSYKNIQVIQSHTGWGNAVIEGIKHAKGNYICYMVSDDQVDGSHIKTLYKVIRDNNVSLVKVYRKNRENKKRFIISYLYNLIANIIFRLNAHDINATPKILKSDAIKNFTFVSNNISFDLELLLKLKNKRLSWIEIPIYSRKRGQGVSTTNIKTAFEMLYFMLKFRFR